MFKYLINTIARMLPRTSSSVEMNKLKNKFPFSLFRARTHPIEQAEQTFQHIAQTHTFHRNTGFALISLIRAFVVYQLLSSGGELVLQSD